MSRHTIPHPTIAGRKLAYGYDRPLSYYFWQVFDGDHPDPDNIVDSDNFRGCSGGKLLDAAEHHGFSLYSGHALEAALDMPISEEPIPDDWKPTPVPGWKPPAKWSWNGVESLNETTMARKVEEALEAFLEAAENSNVVVDAQGRERLIQISVSFNDPAEEE